MARKRQVPENLRRTPRQARAQATTEAILEAAAQILERDGLAAFNTNAIAERAGVSVGTLYQYFDDKNALILAIARQEIAKVVQAAMRDLAAEPDSDIEGRVRSTIRTMAHAFGGRQKARKAIVQAVFARGLGDEFLAPLTHFTDLLARQIASLAASRGRANDATLSSAQARLRAFVLSRAVLGAIRAAVFEEQTFLKSVEFEDELARLVLAYVGPSAPSA